MTITSSGQLVLGSTTSNGEFISGSFTTSGAMVLGVTEPVYIYPIIEYNEDTEMFQVSGTSKAHPVQIRSLTTGELVTSVAGTITCTYSLNGGNPTEFTPDPTPVYSNTMRRWLITVPSSFGGTTLTAYDSVEINLSCTEGDGFAMINIVPDLSTLEVSATGGGAGHIITAYTFDPTNNTITITETGYTDIKQEQILSIFNSTTGQWYYNSELRRYGADPGRPWTKYYPISSVSGGVITYTATDLGATENDVLQIMVNIA